MTTTRVAQSLKTLGGAAFERIVATILNGFLQNDNILVTRAKEDELKKFIRDGKNLFQIPAFTRIPVKRSCNQSQLENYPDLDLFALIKTSQFGQQ